MKLKPALEQRISEVRADCVAYIHLRAQEIKEGSPGVPLESILVILNAAGCPCIAALDVAKTRRRDEAIAKSQQPSA